MLNSNKWKKPLQSDNYDIVTKEIRATSERKTKLSKKTFRMTK